MAEEKSKKARGRLLPLQKIPHARGAVVSGALALCAARPGDTGTYRTIRNQLACRHVFLFRRRHRGSFFIAPGSSPSAPGACKSARGWRAE